jgi:hypothetical protein
MKSIAVAALAVALCIALTPRSPQAADVDRVQRACAELRRAYEGAPAPKDAAMMRKAWGDKAWRPATQNLIDSRVYDLFCH